ncbi:MULTISPECIES: ABC transporter ATP-binding protein [Winkia]|uniref:ABC transporter ATP-binding protein n=2 Tax=Winkia neuii TaxID=33007 RepID=A0AB38XQ98_9ACTO|nr:MULTISPECIES: ABC transporter ATP-binding protein [Winkia]MBS5946750.1 ABC transporter ATP-binding protein [Winkia neuii]MDK7163672.1 ABC transporter ATP-binding protein [Winkia sp. UMB3105]MDK8595418.1 ABC transporter ATP-binding protein [Winkia sp. UMB1096A]MDU2269079.1 ABC transporter ATP-binding protein [Winkia neuii]WCE46503.1 ABC transporter ATP-binding protein [Winkia neuii subsp. anitrata]
MKKTILAARNISKSFGKVRALADVSLQLRAGEALAVMGPSGSGKSTLLHCLSGVLTPDTGSIVFEGEELSTMSDAARSAMRLGSFGFVFQDGALLPELPARDNVALPLQLRGMKRAQALRVATDAMARLGIADKANVLPGDMSGGQAQRVAIARAIVTNPAIMFADEPTGALDQPTSHEVMQVLTALARIFDTALVIVTHDLNVASWCNRVVEIRDGLVHSEQLIGGKDA